MWEMFSGFLRLDWSPLFANFRNHQQSNEMFARSTVRLWDMQRSQTCCAVLFFTSFESFSYAWSQCICLPLGHLDPPCVQGQLLGAADAKNRDQASHGNFQMWPVWSSMKYARTSNARDLGTIERLQGFDSQAFFHGRPFARESLQPPWTAWNSLDLAWELM